MGLAQLAARNIANRTPRPSPSFARSMNLEIACRQYIQWQLDLQLKEAQERALASGMRIGLYHDMPLAVDSSGFDAWMRKDLFRRRHERRSAARPLFPQRPGLGIRSHATRRNAAGPVWLFRGIGPPGHALRRRHAHRPRHAVRAPVLGSGGRNSFRRRVRQISRPTI